MAAAVSKIVGWALQPAPNLDAELARLAPERSADVSSKASRTRDLTEALESYFSHLGAIGQAILDNSAAKEEVNFCAKLFAWEGKRDEHLITALTTSTQEWLRAKKIEKQALDTLTLLAFAYRASRQLASHADDYEVGESIEQRQKFTRDCAEVTAYIRSLAGSVAACYYHLVERTAQHESDLQNRCKEMHKEVTWDLFLSQTKSGYKVPEVEKGKAPPTPLFGSMMTIPPLVRDALKGFGVSEEVLKLGIASKESGPPGKKNK